MQFQIYVTKRTETTSVLKHTQSFSLQYWKRKDMEVAE